MRKVSSWELIEGLRDSALRRELRKTVRDQPDCGLLDVMLMYGVVKSSQVKSEVSEE